MKIFFSHCILAFFVALAWESSAQNQTDEIESLKKLIRSQSKRIDSLENKMCELEIRPLIKPSGKGTPDWTAQADNFKRGLKLNFYGDASYSYGHGPYSIANGGSFLDMNRFSMLADYPLSDYATFTSELGLVGPSVATEKMIIRRFAGGELVLEQFHADVKINDYLNWCSLGL